MSDKQKVFRIGPIRPPSEADSLLLQVTEGCTWNKCRFCNLYRHTKFRAYTVDSIKEDIDIMDWYASLIKKHRKTGQWDIAAINAEMDHMSSEEANCCYMIANWLISGGKNVFLQDGNTLALSAGKLIEVLKYLREIFPQIERITSYGRAETLSKVSVEEYKELKNVGLDRIHSGFETGCDAVLELINKGTTVEQEIRAGKNIKGGGIELSVYFMPGVGGKELSVDNAMGTSHVVREIDPDFVRIRTAALKPGTELYELYQQGRFTMCSDDDKLNEIKLLIENTKECSGRLVSDHIINLLQTVEGSLKDDRLKMLATIDAYFSLPEKERKIFQLARRSGGVTSIEDLSRMTEQQREKLENISMNYGSGRKWDEAMNEMISRYI